MNISVVILCGGSGTRLWPLSRSDYPKQFISLVGDNSLFQETINRFLSISDNDDIKIDEFLIITNENHRFLVLEQLGNLKLKVPFRIILEPEQRNTAPAITLAALAAFEKNPETTLIVTPSDHYVKNIRSYINSVNNALKKVEDNTIFTLGIKPLRPDSGFGYIHFSGHPSSVQKKVIDFKEKPTLNETKKMIDDGCHVWNSGVFILKSITWLDSIALANHKIYSFVKNSWNKKNSDQWFERPNSEIFKKSPSDSIDYAVMENFKKLNLNVGLFIINAGWTDLGSYCALEDIENKDSNGNILKGDVISSNTKNTIAFATKKNISLLGVDNLIVIETEDTVLVANKENAQSLKEFVNILKKNHEHLLVEHIKVNRPWGWFETMDFGSNFKVKKLLVKPGEKLSYQSHKFRNEHWVVIDGKATIVCDDEYKTLYNNQSTYIKAGVKHQLMNCEQEDLIIIEVQIGSKVIEGDIERFKDIYGRL